MITPKMPKLGPDNNFTVYIYIYISLSLYLSPCVSSAGQPKTPFEFWVSLMFPHHHDQPHLHHRPPGRVQGPPLAHFAVVFLVCCGRMVVCLERSGPEKRLPSKFVGRLSLVFAARNDARFSVLSFSLCEGDCFRESSPPLFSIRPGNHRESILCLGCFWLLGLCWCCFCETSCLYLPYIRQSGHPRNCVAQGASPKKGHASKLARSSAIYDDSNHYHRTMTMETDDHEDQERQDRTTRLDINDSPSEHLTTQTPERAQTFQSFAYVFPYLCVFFLRNRRLKNKIFVKFYWSDRSLCLKFCRRPCSRFLSIFSFFLFFLCLLCLREKIR